MTIGVAMRRRATTKRMMESDGFCFWGLKFEYLGNRAGKHDIVSVGKFLWVGKVEQAKIFPPFTSLGTRNFDLFWGVGKRGGE
jgi:hypothetical protein